MKPLLRCSQCGARHPSDSSAGLCPACLIRVVLDEGDAPASEPAVEAPNPTFMARAGARLGDYQLESPLGEGGMGVVFRARQLKLNRAVAVKLLPFGPFAPESHQRQLQSEAETIAQLRHPNIVTIHELGEWAGQHFLAMELVEGDDLGRILQARALPIRSAVELLRKVAGAIALAHSRGIAHRDLKPSNIVVGADGEPRVTDFGLARNAHTSAETTLAGRPFGSPNYMPPEQARGQRDADPYLSDVYGLGAILYHLLTRRPPFVGDSVGEVFQQLAESDPVEPRALNPAVSRDLETICLKCLEKDPARRYPSAEAFEAELGRLLRDEPIHARPIGWLGRTWRWCRRRPALAAMTAATACALGGGFASSLILWRQAQQSAVHARAAQRKVELERVEDLLDRGAAPEALARLGRLLRANPGDDGAAQRLMSALVHRNFLRPDSPSVLLEHSGSTSPLALASGRLVTTGSTATELVIRDTSRELAEVVRLQLWAPAVVAALSADAGYLAVGLRDRTAQVWTQGSPPSLVQTLTLNGTPAHLQLDPAGQRLLATLSTRGVLLFDLREGRVIRTLPTAHFSDLSPDGRLFVTATNAEATVWDAITGSKTERVLKHRYRIETVRFSADSRRLVTSSADMTAGVWELDPSRPPGPQLLHDEHVLDAVFSPDGARVLTRAISEQGQLWDAVTGVPLGARFPLWRALHPAQFSPDGLSVLSHYHDRVVLRDAFTGEPLAEPIVAGSTSALRFLPDAKRFLVAAYAGSVRSWSVLPGQSSPLLFPHQLEVRGALLSPAGDRVLTFGTDRWAGLWSAADGQLQHRLNQGRRITAATFNSSGTIAATGDANGQVKVWEVATGQPMAGPAPQAGEILHLEFLAGSQTLLIAPAGGPVLLWSADTKPPRSLGSDRRSVARRVAVDSTGARVATTSGSDNVIRLWRTADGAHLGDLGPAPSVSSLAFSPDGGVLASGDGVGRIQFWNLADQTRAGGTMESHAGSVVSLQYSADGKQLVSASVDHTARVWNATTGQPLTRPLEHEGTVLAATLSPDGRLLATGSADNTARIWNALTGEPVSDAWRHEARVMDVRWFADGRSILTASWDGLARRWRLANPPLSRAGRSWLAGAAETLGGLRLGSSESMQRVDPDLSPSQLQLPSAADDPNFVAWGRWLVQPRAQRSLVPGTDLTAADFFRGRLDEKRVDRLRAHLRFLPGDASALASWSRLVLAQPPERNPRWAREAAFAAERATQIDPANFDAWWSLAQVRLAAGEVASAQAAFSRAEQLQPGNLPAAERQALTAFRQRLARREELQKTPAR